MDKAIKKMSKKVTKIAIQAAQARTQGGSALEAQEAMTQRAIKNFEQAQLDGKDAYANLCKLKSDKLPRGVEEILARRLFSELRNLFARLKSKGISKAEFCSRHGLNDGNETSKELSRLTVRPDANSDEVKARRLRRSADKYRRLIDGIQSETGENRNHLVDRIFYGTPLHPTKQMEQFDRAEKVMHALQAIVDRIDRDLGLYEKFMEVDRLKTEYRSNGFTDNWPLSDVDSSELAAATIESTNESIINETNSCHFNNGFHEFWKGLNPESGKIEIKWNISTYFPHPEFFFVPHVKLGWLDTCNLPDRKAAPVEYKRARDKAVQHVQKIMPDHEKSIASIVASARIEWDEASASPVERGFTREFGFRDIGWIAIYPSTDKTKLLPWLYSIGEFPYLIPLNVRTLEEFENGIWVDENNNTDLLDRIFDLIGFYPDQTHVIEDGLRATASWLDHNPIFKAHELKKKAGAKDAEMMQRYLAELRNDLDA